MKQLITILLCTLILFFSGTKTIILLNYLVNKENIAKNLCENRNKPGMNCKGKCHLKKELQKDEKRDNPAGGGIKENKEVQLFHGSVTLACPIDEQMIITHQFMYDLNYPGVYHGGIFQPPKV